MVEQSGGAPKNLLVFCDGTWSASDQKEGGLATPTNVVRLKNALSPTDKSGCEQRTYYHPGVGTEGDIFSRLAGGAYGKGLSQNIQSAYGWLAKNYQPGDAIYLFGFSRGAFTVRSLGGLLSRMGLFDGSGLPSDELWQNVERAYEGYRAKVRPASRLPGFRDEVVPVTFIGVWDTVGSLGIPDDMALLNHLDRPENWRFHDTHLGPTVRFARHALALDERRASFTPTLWTDPKTHVPHHDNQRVKQVWFPGSHSDVGGGILDSGLADGALHWMMTELSTCSREYGRELGFEVSAIAQVVPQARAPRHDSFVGPFSWLKSRPRAWPDFEGDPSRFHSTVLERRKGPPLTDSPYHPSKRLQVGQSLECEVYARERWNALHVYLERGAVYRFFARGTWLSGSKTTGPEGLTGIIERIPLLFSNLLGEAESFYRTATQNPSAHFALTRRYEYFPWFSLVGAIANDGRWEATENDGTPGEHQVFPIGTEHTLTVSDPGYLYAFMNDAWDLYGNNRGSLSLTIERLS
jgi:hypothetical protein